MVQLHTNDGVILICTTTLWCATERFPCCFSWKKEEAHSLFVLFSLFFRVWLLIDRWSDDMCVKNCCWILQMMVPPHWRQYEDLAWLAQRAAEPWATCGKMKNSPTIVVSYDTTFFFCSSLQSVPLVQHFYLAARICGHTAVGPLSLRSPEPLPPLLRFLTRERVQHSRIYRFHCKVANELLPERIEPLTLPLQ